MNKSKALETDQSEPLNHPTPTVHIVCLAVQQEVVGTLVPEVVVVNDAIYTGSGAVVTRRVREKNKEILACFRVFETF